MAGSGRETPHRNRPRAASGPQGRRGGPNPAVLGWGGQAPCPVKAARTAADGQHLPARGSTEGRLIGRPSSELYLTHAETAWQAIVGGCLGIESSSAVQR